MENIPKIFWYAVSLCIVAITTTICYVVINSTSSSIKVQFANANIEIAREKANLIEKTSQLSLVRDNLASVIDNMKTQQDITSLAKQLGNKDSDQNLNNNYEIIKKATSKLNQTEQLLKNTQINLNSPDK